MKRNTALVTGIFGQDGSYLCEMLLDKGYSVHGIGNIVPSDNSRKIKQHLSSLGYEPQTHSCDLYDYTQVKDLISELRPDEVYHMAATHYPSETRAESGELNVRLFNRNVTATINLLTAIEHYSPQSRSVLAGSCLMYDASNESPQDDATPYRTKSVYGLSKLTESNIGEYFRNQGFHVSVAILYNHESPRRLEGFVTRKIVRNMILLKDGTIDSFKLGALDTVKDWGYARDYVYGMWLMGRTGQAGHYILATGEPHTIEEFADCVARVLGLRDWKDAVVLDGSILKRTTDVVLVGRAGKAERLLRWRRTRDFHQLIELMVENEIAGTLD